VGQVTHRRTCAPANHQRDAALAAR